MGVPGRRARPHRLSDRGRQAARRGLGGRGLHRGDAHAGFDPDLRRRRRRRNEIRTDQINCMGCLSACQFSNWAQNEAGTTGKKADPRSFCIQKTLQAISHSDGYRRSS